MKKLYLIFLFLAIASAHSQTAALSWIKTLNNKNCGDGYRIARDASNNIYVTGFFGDTTDFDPGPAVSNLMPFGAFVLKLNASGQFVWAKSIGDTSSFLRSYSIQCDATGNIYISGVFLGNVDFNPGPGIFSLSSPQNSEDMFILKLDNNGDLLWAKNIAGTYNSDSDNLLSVDPAGNIYLAGSFHSTFDFDPGPGVCSLSSDSSWNNAFISKFDASGNFAWAKNIGNSGNDECISVKTDASGNVYACGFFNGTVDFDPGAGASFMQSAGYDNAFVLKLNTSGDFVWSGAMRSFSGYSYANDLALDASGNIFLTGSFSSITDFDPGAGQCYLNASSAETFVLKLNQTGNFVWVKNYGISYSNYGTQGTSIALSPEGDIYISGEFTGTVNFDPGVNSYTAAVSSRDIFIVKLNSSGNFLSLMTFGGSKDDRADALLCDNQGNLYCSGNFGGTVDFDPGPGSSNTTAQGLKDVFILKLNFLVSGIESQYVENNSVKAFPNPCREAFYFDALQKIKNGEVRLFNSLGKEVYHCDISEENNEVKIQNLAKGIYFYSLFENGSLIKSGKIIAE